MNKWYHPFGLILLAALVGDLSGCAQTSSWLAKKPSKKTEEKEKDQAIASKSKKSSEKAAKDKDTDKDKLAKAKSTKDKSSKELADAKASDSKSTTQPKKAGSKAVDAEHEKYTAAESAKRKNRGKLGTTKDDSKAVASADTKKAKPKSQSKSAKSDLQDDVAMTAAADATAVAATDAVAKASAKTSPKKTASTATAAAAASKKASDSDPFEEDIAPSKPNVVQVKKVESSDDDFGQFEDDEPQKEPKSVKTASIAENFEDELISPLSEDAKVDFDFDDESDQKDMNRKAEIADNEEASSLDSVATVSKNNAKVKQAASEWDEDLSEASADSKPQSQPKKTSSQGLLGLCPSATGELSEILKSMDPADSDSLKNGIHRIGQMSKGGVSAAPALRQMLKHEDLFVRAHSALAMARLGIIEPESVVAVAEALTAQDPALRSFGAQVLEEMGPQTNDVLAALSKNLKASDGLVRIRSAEVLIMYEEWSYPALQALLVCLKDKDENVRWLTAYAIADLQPESPEAVQALMKAVHDPVAKVRVGAAYALGEIGPIAKRSSDELRKVAAKTNDEELKKTIAYSLEQLNKDSQ
jgi:HEAT repeat protein